MKVGERGQITIPRALREKYGLRPFAAVEFVEVGDRLVLRRAVPRCPIEAFVGILGGRGERTHELIERLRGR